MNFLKNIITKVNSNKILTKISTAMLVIYTTGANAAVSSAKDFTGVASNFGNAANEFGKTAVSVATLIGVVLVCAGLWHWYKEGKEEGRGHMKKGFIAVIVGLFFVALPKFVSLGENTIGADDAAIQTKFDKF